MKKIACALLAILLICPLVAFTSSEKIYDGSTITLNTKSQVVCLIQDRLRELGYLNFRDSYRFADMTYKAVISFQVNNGLTGDGNVGADTFYAMFDPEAKRKPINPQVVIHSGPGYTAQQQISGEATPWSKVDSLIPIGTDFTITDCKTATSFQMRRTGGVHHAKVEPLTQEDTQSFLKIFGGTPNWEKRPCVVTIGQQKIACSLFGMPEGADTIPGNGMEGNTSLYFQDSVSDIGGTPDIEHQEAVQSAVG